MPTATDRATLLRDLCAALHDGEGFPVLGTTSGLGSTTTLLDATNLLYADADPDALGNPILRIDQLVGAGPAAGSFATVRDGGLAPTTGIITFSPALAAVQAATNYSLWKVCHPLVAVRALSRVLRILRREVLITVSALSNPDLEVDTAGWSPTNATLTRDTQAGNVMHGTAALSVAPSAGAPIADSSVTVVAGEQWLLAAFLRESGTSGFKLVARDGTALIDIVSATVAQRGYVELVAGGGVFTVPSGCDTLTARLQGVGSGDTGLVDSVCLWPVLRSWFTLPSYIEDPEDVVEVGYFRLGNAVGGANVHAYYVNQGEWVPWRWRFTNPRIEEGGVRPLQIEFDTPLIRPLYVRVRRPFADMTADTDTTSADRDLVVGLAQREVYRILRTQARARKDAAAEQIWDKAVGEASQLAVVRSFESRFGRQRLTVEAPRRGPSAFRRRRL